MDGGWFHLVAAFTGGLGFFLLGMKRMTDGLKVAAGAALQRVLEASTRTRLRAFFAGGGEVDQEKTSLSPLEGQHME